MKDQIDFVLGPWLVGIDNVSPDTDIPHGAVRDAVNGDFDRAGGFNRRPGVTALLLQAGMHSLWSSTAMRASFCGSGNQLCRVQFDGASLTLTPLMTLPSAAPLSFCDLNDTVVFSSQHAVGVIAADMTAKLLGVEQPQPPGVAAATAGGLYAGRYGVAITFIAGNEESSRSDAVFVDVAEGGGLRLTMPQPTESNVTAVRVYRTQANGDVFYRAADVPLGMTSYLVGAGAVGRACDTAHLQRMMPGAIVRAWRGRLLCARGRTVYFSEPMRYGLYSPRDGFVQFGAAVTMVESVEGGVFIGTRTGVYFLSGASPKEWAAVRTSGSPPVPGTGVRVPANLLSGDLGATGVYAAMWLSENGFVVGSSTGQLVELQGKRIRLPESQVISGAGAVALHDRRCTVVIN